jgi:hypothetical protein
MELQRYRGGLLEFINHSIHKGALPRTNMYQEDNSMHNPNVERARTGAQDLRGAVEEARGMRRNGVRRLKIRWHQPLLFSFPSTVWPAGLSVWSSEFSGHYKTVVAHAGIHVLNCLIGFWLSRLTNKSSFIYSEASPVLDGRRILVQPKPGRTLPSNAAFEKYDEAFKHQVGGMVLDGGKMVRATG